MGKASAVLELFPSCYGIHGPRKLLRHTVEALARPLEEADSHLFRIQRAHRLDVAERAEDIVALAAALDLAAFHFADVLEDEGLDYDEKLRLMRRRVMRVASLHLEGTGTPWAVIEGTAVFLDSAVVPPEGTGRRFRTIDPEGFSHRAELASDRGGARSLASVHIYENPRRRKKVEPVDRWPLLDWRCANESVLPAPTRISIRGVGERTVRPAVVCPDRGQGILFHGVVPDGATLLVDRAGARLDGMPVDDWITFFEGGVHDYGRLDESAAVTEVGEAPPRPFDRDRHYSTASPVRRPRPAPEAPVGTSRWFLQVAEGVFGGGTFDYATFGTPHLPVGAFDGESGFDAAVFYYPPSAVAGMAWDERIPCAFKLTLPPGFGVAPPAEDPAPAWLLGRDALRTFEASDADDTEAPGTRLATDPRARADREVADRIASLVPRFKPAGVRSFVEPRRPAWMLGSSVLRGTEARWGKGIVTDSTHLADPYRDAMVHL